MFYVNRACPFLLNYIKEGTGRLIEIVVRFGKNVRSRYKIDIAPVAQLDRASGFEPAGRPFESDQARVI